MTNMLDCEAERAERNWRIIMLLGTMMLIGLCFRIFNCWNGYPYHFHPDEPTVVASAIRMIKRRSWEALIYNRPDHFEIKCCSLIFQIFSYCKYHVSADVAFNAGHEWDFYFIARCYTAVIGTLMIPLAYKILEKCKKNSGLIGAAITAFFSIFIQHSSYATPDIVLTFLVMSVVYLSILYMEEPSAKRIVQMSVVIGLGITTKYTAAIMAPYCACIVIYDCIKRKEYKQIFKFALLAIFGVLATCFVMSPDLFTNIGAVIKAFIKEARPTHAGADGLTPWGNFKYYFNVFHGQMGKLLMAFEALGLFYLWKAKNRNHLCFLCGAIFWVCTSILHLHWVRWGMPIYIFYVLLASLGMSYLFDILKSCKRSVNLIYARCAKCGCVVLACILLVFAIRMILLDVSITLNSLTPNTIVKALEYCNENGITKNNSVYDGYSPFSFRGGPRVPVRLDENGEIVLIERNKGKWVDSPADKQDKIPYIILSTALHGRYYRERARYADYIAVYEAIKKQCKLVKKISGTAGFRTTGFLYPDIISYYKYICGHNKNSMQGSTITIYKRSLPGPISRRTARLDIKLTGENAKFELLEKSDANAKADMPKWFQKGGKGYQVESSDGKIKLTFKVEIDGKLNVNLRGRDIRTLEDNKKRIPVWIDYTSFKFNGKEELAETTAVWHDKSKGLSYQVKAGDIIIIESAWESHKEPQLKQK